MKLEFSPEADAVCLEASDADVERCGEIKSHVVIDSDSDGKVVDEKTSMSAREFAPPLK